MHLLASLDSVLATALLGGALNDIWIYFLRGLFFVCAVLLIVIVLLQEGKGGGLAAALGGQGAETFGVASGGVNKVTMSLAGLLLLSGVLHAVSYNQSVITTIEKTGTKATTTDDGSGDEAGDGEAGGGETGDESGDESTDK